MKLVKIEKYYINLESIVCVEVNDNHIKVSLLWDVSITLTNESSRKELLEGLDSLIPN